MSDLTAAIRDNYRAYQNKLQAQEIRACNFYASEYYKDILPETKSLLERALLEVSEGFHYDIKYSLFVLNIDYDGMISKVYASGDFTLKEKEYIALSLDDMFKYHFENAFDVLSLIYEKYEGSPLSV